MRIGKEIKPFAPIQPSKSGIGATGKSSQWWALNAACPTPKSSVSTRYIQAQRPHTYKIFPSNSGIRHRNRRGRVGFADKDRLESRGRSAMAPKTRVCP